MRNCPNCGEGEIEEWRLVLQYLGVPAIVAECKKCHAVVFIRERRNIFIDIARDISIYAAIIILMICSFNITQKFWPGIVFGIVVYVGYICVKSKEKLEYVR